MTLLELIAACPRGWFCWLDLAGYHARHASEPKGSPPRVSAPIPEGVLEKIRAARGESARQDASPLNGIQARPPTTSPVG
jgi:hypothetical protein